MPKDKKPLTSYQKGIVKRYYENRKDIGHQALSELISDLYIETNSAKKEKIWSRIAIALNNSGASKEKVASLLASKDIKALAEYATESF